MRPPSFWTTDGLAARLLSPASAVVAAATARRVARPGWRAPVTVICCGNAGVGGAGKTTLALDLARRLAPHKPHLLTRGHGGRKPREGSTVRVDPDAHSAADVGDEALLLARVAPTWVGHDRAASARAAIGEGAGMLVMDDGLQNPTLEKTVSLLVIDGAAGFGNGRVLPAGPLREPIGVAASRCHVAVLIGEDRTGALSALPPGLPVLRADLVASVEAASLRGRPVLAFAAIQRPSKFFETLAAAGVTPVATAEFADHHRFTAHDLEGLRRRAEALGAVLATTPKDAVRLPPDFRTQVVVIGVDLVWRDPDSLRWMLPCVG